tara:strand:- start:2270 stop:3298 length:1029 start_codon:yes stop_codon:yes gene_type:complete
MSIGFQIYREMTNVQLEITDNMKKGQVIRDITLDDYNVDPTNCGTRAIAELFPGFKHQDIRTSGAVIRLRHGGSGPPLLLLHGNPENHVSWYKVASRLAESYHVVIPDLRGYGDSSLPEPGDNHINFSFREMALDMVEVMATLGYEEFYVAGHDRGGRTVHRMCIDHPERILKVCLMDVLPNHFVWNNTSKDWVVRTWHWGFMAQPAPLPERMISAVSAEFFLTSRMVIRGGTGLGFLTEDALNEYIRCYTLKTITGSCNDYRATATCDLEMDTADKDKKVIQPLLLVWGAKGQSEERSQAFVDVWHGYADNIIDADPLQCGHYIQEEVPDQIYDHFTKFFR